MNVPAGWSAFKGDKALARIVQQPRCFDFPLVAPPSHLFYTAPWHQPGRDDDIDFPWELLENNQPQDKRPLVYASLGTIQNRNSRLYEIICATAKNLPYQFVLSLGNSDATLELPCPENVLLVKHAPQLKLIDRADLVITHCGLNTTLECLTRGVPMVGIPITNDQPGVARRIEYHGVGEIITTEMLNPERLSKLIHQVLLDEKYRQKSRLLKSELAQFNGVKNACDLIEQVFSQVSIDRETMSVD